MSDAGGNGGAGTREVAYRVLAAEYDDATFEHADSDEERAPSYVVTPTGARVNRLFLVGVLTAVEPVNEEMVRARIVDPTGAFVVYAGQYQPDELAFLERADPPAFVAVTGKARTFSPEDSDVIYTSVRPESINEVTAETRDRWTVTAAEQTLDRIGTVAEAIRSELEGDRLRAALADAGASDATVSGVSLALAEYGTTPAYLAALRETALDAARVVAGERDEVPPLSVEPDDPGDADLNVLADLGSIGRLAAPEPDAESEESADSDPVESEADGAAAGTARGSEPERDTEFDDSAVEDGSDEPDERSETDAETATADETDEPPVAAAADDGADVSEESDSADEWEADSDAATDAGEESDADPDAMYEFEDGERERIEEEYGTEFTTASEVEEPGEAGIETEADTDDTEPISGEAAEEPATEPEDTDPIAGELDEGTTADEPDDGSDDVDEIEESDAGEDETDAEVDLEDAVMDAMQELSDGGPADREAVIAAVIEAHGATPDEIEDAIQSALMDGRCYEPDEHSLQPI